MRAAQGAVSQLSGVAGSGGVPAVDVRGVTCGYGVSAEVEPVLEDVSLRVGQQEFLILVGPSGCGKSTLLKAIGKLLTPLSGEIEYAGRDGVSPGIATVFQEDRLFPWLRADKNVAFGLRIKGVSRGERLARARDELERVGLSGSEALYPSQLSGGMRQRVNLARALAMDPEILLMDEPFAALDVQTKLKMQLELLQIWEKDRRTVVFVTHSIQEALLLGDRIAVMGCEPGQIIETLDVPFDRPREDDLRFTESFRELERHIWNLLKDQ